MHIRDLEKFTEPQYIFGAIGVVMVTWLLSYFYKDRKVKRKIKNKHSECQASLKKLDEYLGENGISDKQQAEIQKLSLMELWVKLQSGQLLAQDTLKAYQAKALEVNKRLNCLVEPVWEAEPEALQCDMEEKEKKGLLHGIPISIKENYYIQGYDSTGGMCALVDHPAREDGVLLKVLRKQGAVPYVRTNIPQLMMTFECANPIYGVTVNPHNIKRSPGGSSGGEGALLAAGGSILGFGSDIGGSLRIPSQFCGVCCLKPTFGRLSLRTCEEIVHGQSLVLSTPGPLGRDVDSLVLAMRAVLCPYMFQLDPEVPPIPFRNEIYESKKKLRIGFYTNDGYLSCIPAVERAMEMAKEALQKKGHTLVPFQPPRIQYMFTELFIKATFGDGGAKYFELFEEDIYDPTISLMLRAMKLPAFVQRVIASLMDIFTGDRIPGAVIRSMLGVHSVSEWWELSEKISQYKAEFLSAWKASKLDVVICPTFPFPACPTGTVKYVVGGATYTTLYNLINYPAGSLPVTKVTAVDETKMKDYPTKRTSEQFIKKYFSAGTGGLPVSVQCVGLPFQEEMVLRLMKELEDAIKK